MANHEEQAGETTKQTVDEAGAALASPLPSLNRETGRPHEAFWMFPLTRIVFFLLVFVGALLLLGGMGVAILTLAGSAAFLADGANAILAQGVVSGVAALVAFVALGRFVERRTPRQYGLAASSCARALRDVAVGAALGAALMGATIGIFAVAGWYRAGAASNLAAIALPFGMTLVCLFLAALFEEILFRAVIFRITEEKWGTYIGIGVSAALFGLIHRMNPGASALSSVFIAVEAGLLLAVAYALTRNVWLVTGLHWAWNVTQGPILGAPVSGLDGFPRLLNARVSGPALWTGGVFGPEAGLVACLLATALGVALLVRLSRRPGGIVASEARRRREPLPT